MSRLLADISSSDIEMIEYEIYDAERESDGTVFEVLEIMGLKQSESCNGVDIKFSKSVETRYVYRELDLSADYTISLVIKDDNAFFTLDIHKQDEIPKLFSQQVAWLKNSIMFWVEVNGIEQVLAFDFEPKVQEQIAEWLVSMIEEYNAELTEPKLETEES